MEVGLKNLPENAVFLVNQKGNGDGSVRRYEIRAPLFGLGGRHKGHGICAHWLDRELRAEAAHIFIKKAQIQGSAQKRIADVVTIHRPQEQAGVGRPLMKFLQESGKTIAEQRFANPNG